MKVRDLCNRNVAAISRDTTLARAGALMRKYDVSALPVVDRTDRVIGVVTDRDLLLELARRNTPPAEVFVHEAMTRRPAVSLPHDSLTQALDIMRRNHVRRLPVVTEDDRLLGMISIDDIIVQAVEGKGRELPWEDVLFTLSEISEEYHPQEPPPRASFAPYSTHARDREHSFASSRFHESY